MTSLRALFLFLCSSQPFQDATAWNWNFGDGTSSKDENPVHAYLKAGKYTVTLTAATGKDSSTKIMDGYITVYNGKK